MKKVTQDQINNLALAYSKYIVDHLREDELREKAQSWFISSVMVDGGTPERDDVDHFEDLLDSMVLEGLSSDEIVKLMVEAGIDKNTASAVVCDLHLSHCNHMLLQIADSRLNQSTNQGQMKSIVRGKIYQIPGFVYDEDRPEFDCLIPVFTGDFYIVDCLICDKSGNLHPGYQVGVPVETEGMGLLKN